MVKKVFVPVGKYVFNFLRLRKFDFLVVTKNQKLFHYSSRVATRIYVYLNTCCIS
jgi:hypothetical protein